MDIVENNNTNQKQVSLSLVDGTKNDGTKNDGTKNDGTKNDGTKKINIITKKSSYSNIKWLTGC